MRHGGGAWRRGPVRPRGIDRVRGHGDHRQAGFGIPREPFLADQPGIVTNPRPRRSMGRDPGLGRVFGDMQPFPDRPIRLAGELQHVSSIGEHRRLVHQHHREPGAAGEAGEPCQTFRRRGHIFAQMLIGARDEEALETERGKFFSERGGGCFGHFILLCRDPAKFHICYGQHALNAWRSWGFGAYSQRPAALCCVAPKPGGAPPR